MGAAAPIGVFPTNERMSRPPVLVEDDIFAGDSRSVVLDVFASSTAASFLAACLAASAAAEAAKALADGC